MSNANKSNSKSRVVNIKVGRNPDRSSSDDPIFPCPLCPNIFPSKEDLKIHIIAEHPCMVDEQGHSKFDASNKAYQKWVIDMINHSIQPGAPENSLKLRLCSANKIERMIFSMPDKFLRHIARNQQSNGLSDSSKDDNAESSDSSEDDNAESSDSSKDDNAAGPSVT